EKIAVARVGLLGSAEPRILAEGPQPAPVAVREVPAREGERAGRRDRLGSGEVARAVAHLERDPGFAANRVVHHPPQSPSQAPAVRRGPATPPPRPSQWKPAMPQSPGGILTPGHKRSAPMPEPGAARSSGGVRVEFDGGVAIVTIDRPEARNAIGFTTTDELGTALDHVLACDPAVLVLRGGGDRAFVSGGD